MKYPIVLSVILLLSAWRPAFSEDAGSSRPSLAGIKSVQVVVEDLSDDAKVIGLTREMLQTDVELRLRKAGVRVQPGPLGSYLYVNVTILTSPTGSHVAYSVRVEYLQFVEILQLPLRTIAPTWSTGVLGVSGIRTQNVRGDVGDLVDEFINAYLSVNPK